MHTLVEQITGRVKSDRSTILVTLCCGILTVMVVTNFYVSAVLMGTMFKELYDRRGIHRSVLSRTIEEANTIILPLVPWNTGCIYYMGLFGFTTMSFAPYVVYAPGTGEGSVWNLSGHIFNTGTWTVQGLSLIHISI